MLDLGVEHVEFILLGQSALQDQVAHFREGRLLGELANRVTPVQQDALVAVDEGYLALAAGCRSEARVECEMIGFGVEFADIHNVWTMCSGEHWQVICVTGNFEFGGSGVLRLVFHQHLPFMFSVCPAWLMSQPGRFDRQSARALPLCRAIPAPAQCRVREGRQ